jgi:hypothetical protein
MREIFANAAHFRYPKALFISDLHFTFAIIRGIGEWTSTTS